MSRSSILHNSLVIAFVFIASARVGSATEPLRIWVDAGAIYTVEARLVEVREDEVELLRKDGGRIAIAIDMLSEKDKEYIENVGERGMASENPLRTKPPTEPPIIALPVLDLPAASRIAENRSLLQFAPSLKTDLSSELPSSLQADRAPSKLTVSEARIPIEGADIYDDYSRPFPIGSVSGTGMSLAVSISDRTEVPGEKPSHRLIQFDVEAQRSTVKFRHFERIRILDHHLESGRSLVLTGYNSVGQGGQIALVTGWEDRIKLTHRRKLHQDNLAGRLPVVRWAQWIDEEHFVAVMDNTLGMWNLTSGEQVYRIDGVELRATPSLSGGRRYLALPYEGGVQLFAADTGESLGRIGVENQIPGVSFSPYGNRLAISTTRRMRVWDLPTATLSADFECRGGLGSKPPTWVDFDLILSGSGTLLSAFRGLPIWKYDIAATDVRRLGDHTAMLRRHPTNELSIVSLPHALAKEALEFVGNSSTATEEDRWRAMGRSRWSLNGWVDRDVQISSNPSTRR